MVQRKPKKKKNREDLPEGMSRREAKLAARAAEREKLAKALVELTGDEGAFVSDGFGVVHRKQASVYDVAKILPHYAGTLVATEVKVLEQLTSSTERPYAVVLGGSKVSDKLGVIANLLKKADMLFIGGGMVFTFLAAQGYSVGKSLLEADPQVLEDTMREAADRARDAIPDLEDVEFRVGDRTFTY